MSGFPLAGRHRVRAKAVPSKSETEGVSVAGTMFCPHNVGLEERQWRGRRVRVTKAAGQCRSLGGMAPLSAAGQELVPSRLS